MKLNPRYLILLAVILISVGVSSCSDVSPAYNRENIKGTWINYSADNVELPISDYKVYEFKGDDEGFVISARVDIADTTVWHNYLMDYSVYCCDLEAEGSIVGLYGLPNPSYLKANYDFVEHTDTTLTILPTSLKINDTDIESLNTTLSMRKLPRNYQLAQDSLVGVWAVNSKNGETYEEFRIEFKSDNTWVLDDENRGKFSFYKEIVVLESEDDASVWKIVSASPNGSATMELMTDTTTYTFILIPTEEE